MTNQIPYTTIDRILAKLSRDIGEIDASESDIIEWIGEALDHLKVAEMQEEAIAFIEVNNHHCELPANFHSVLQIARNKKWTKLTQEYCGVTPKEMVETVKEENCKCNKPNKFVLTDCNGNLVGDYDIAYYRPFYDLKWEYQPWIHSTRYIQDYVPVRLANSTLFNSLVCKEKDRIYLGNEDEYTIVGTTERRLRFSFKEGFIALSFLRNALDEETGYPLVPDEVNSTTAIGYYIMWKIAQRLDWSGREGFGNRADKAEAKWLKYVRQAKNYMKMPKTLDDYQDLLEQSHQLVPRLDRYYSYFGKTKTQFKYGR